MGKKLVIKTVLICLGIFIIISAVGWFYIFNTYKLDTEPVTTVFVASTTINSSSIINESMLGVKTIKISAATDNMVTDKGECLEYKSIGQIRKGDYIYKNNLIPKNKIYSDDIRAIVLPATIEERLANLVHRGSLIDVIVYPADSLHTPQVVLAKVRVDEVFDDSGINAEGNEIGSRKGFIKLLLNKSQRERIYSAKNFGSLSYELYCDETQKPSREDYKIPELEDQTPEK
jgi:Flp pilus assembly protein CpaB